MTSSLIVSSPDPTLSRGKGLVTIERFLCCVESAVLIFEEVDDYIFMTLRYFIGLFRIDTADLAQPRKCSMITRPFSS